MGIKPNEFNEKEILLKYEYEDSLREQKLFNYENKFVYLIEGEVKNKEKDKDNEYCYEFYSLTGDRIHSSERLKESSDFEQKDESIFIKRNIKNDDYDCLELEVTKVDIKL